MTDAKTYLRKYLESKRLIQSLNNDIEQRTAMVNAACKPFKNVDIQRSPNGNTAENNLVSLMDFKQKKCDAIKLNVIICLYVERSISVMDDSIYRTILYSHYIKGESFQDISKQTGLYCMKIYRLHGEALREWERGTE